MPKNVSRKASNGPWKDKDGLVQPPPSPLPTPSLTSPKIKFSYAVARGEQGVLTYEPYKSLILPYWAFRTVQIAQSSSLALWTIFRSYVEREDFVGADMSRKFIQMGMTRARRYANWKGGRKYQIPKSKGGGREKNERWTAESVDGEEGRKRREKEEASEVFKSVWRRCLEDEGYQALKEEWMREQREWEKRVKDDAADDAADEEHGEEHEGDKTEHQEKSDG